jgi:hypothetical protein
MRRRHAMVEGAALCDEILQDFEAVMASEAQAALNLQEAARESGYSADYLGMLVREGKIPNAGRPRAPKIRRQDLPRKATRLRTPVSPVKLVGASPGQIARAVVTSNSGERR